MNIDNLVKMVNEIGTFFAGDSPPERAPSDVATHLERYWDPRMRREMLAHFAQGGAGLSDLGRRGVAILAAKAAAQAATKAAAGAGAAAGPAPSAAGAKHASDRGMAD